MSSMANYVKMSDLRLLLLLNRGFRCLTMDICMIAITQLGSCVFSIALPLTLIFSGKGNLVSIGILMAAVLACSEAIVFLVKRVVHRPRPYKSQANIINKKPMNCQYSFPSGHTCAAFSLAFVLAASFTGFGYIFFILAALVGLSRIYLGVHYPTDVVVGFMTAYASFLLNTRIFF